jgi:hypothetical protein
MPNKPLPLHLREVQTAGEQLQITAQIATCNLCDRFSSAGFS